MVTIARLINAAVITNTRFLEAFRHLWNPRFGTPVMLWLVPKCLEFLDKRGESPGRSIETIFAADHTLVGEDRQELQDLLVSISDEYESLEQPNIDHLLSEAEKYFQREALLTLSAELEAAADSGNIESAKKLIDEPKLPKLLISDSVNPFTDTIGMRKAFQELPKSLVQLGGAFQELIGRWVIPDSFVAFLGKEKVGKTWMKQSIVFGAVKARTNVLLIQCGDLSEEQQYRRIGLQLSNHHYDPLYCGLCYSPILDCLKHQKGTCDKNASEPIVVADRENGQKSGPYPFLSRYEEVSDWYEPCQQMNCSDFELSTWFEEVQPCDQLTETRVLEIGKKMVSAYGDRLRLLCYANGSVSISQLRETVKSEYEASGWKPQLVVLDYMDNVAPEKNRNEFRHQEEGKWGAARRWSQDEKISLVTSTQAPKKTKLMRLLTDSDMSEDKRKKAHVTEFFGLNKDSHDKRRSWMRVNPLVMREGNLDIYDEVSVLQLIQRGQPNLSSYWIDNRNQRRRDDF